MLEKTPFRQPRLSLQPSAHGSSVLKLGTLDICRVSTAWLSTIRQKNDSGFSTDTNKSVRAIPRTKLPWYAISERDPKDQVFTKQKTANYCWEIFNQVAKKNNFDMKNRIFVEPSAGEGCFIDLFPNEEQKLAFDIDPRREDVIKQDFLEWSPKTAKNIAVVGNPPFGVRGAIALAFINRAAHFADLVSFILPMTFASDGKGGALTRVRGLTLLHSEELPANSFYQPDGAERDINTLWQVWGKGVNKKIVEEKTCNNYIEIFTACTAPNRRCGMRRMHEADFFIQGTFYKPPHVVKNFSDVKYGSGYGIVIKHEKDKVSSLLKNVDWKKHSSRATNHCHHIRMRHIRDAVVEGGFFDE